MGANKEIPKDEIIKILKKAPVPLAIDIKTTKYLVMLSKVELRLLMTLDNTRNINKWLSGCRINANQDSSDDFSWNSLLGFNIVPSRPYRAQNFIEYAPADFNNINDVNGPKYIQRLNIAGIIKQLRYCWNKVIKNWQGKNKASYANSRNFKLINLYSLCDGLGEKVAAVQLAKEFGINEEDFFRGIHVENSYIFPSFKKQYAYDFKQDIDGYEYSDMINFKDNDGAINFDVAKIRSINSNNTIFLPYSTWCQANSPVPIVFHVMPEYNKLPLYNLESIKEFRHIPICLTEHLDIASSIKSCLDAIWTSWYGGIEAIDDVDWTPLRGRSVYYLLWNHSGYNRKILQAKLKTAKKLAAKFFDDINMHFKILIVDTQNGKEYVELVRESELIKIFSSNNIAVPENLEKFKSRRINTNLREKHPDDFLIRPVIKKESLTVLYASAGIGKTWLGLSIGLAIANGVNIFDGWLVSGPPARVLYLLGEMTEEEIENRIFDLNKIYNKNINYSDNLRVCRKNYNLASSKDQRVVDETLKQDKAVSGEGYSLVIIDNLSTLVKNGTHQKAWDSFFKWVETLNDKKITVLLIHHANRGEKFLGTGSIKNMTDFMIRASRVDEIEQNLLKICNSKENKKTIERKKVRACLAPVMPSNGILMYLTHEKVRNLPESNSIPLKAVLSLENTPKWTCSKVNYEQILRELGLSLDELYYDDIYGKNEKSENEDLKMKPIPYEHWKNIPENKFREVLIQCIADEGMTSTKIAARFKVSRSTVEKKREKTKTRKCDLLKEGLIKLKS